MGMDSVELVMDIEKKFNIRIPNSQAETIFTVGDIHAIVWQHLSAGHSDKSKSEMEHEINQVIADKAGFDLSEITPEKRICDDLGMD
jgi:acyl carrier protein